MDLAHVLTQWPLPATTYRQLDVNEHHKRKRRLFGVLLGPCSILTSYIPRLSGDRSIFPLLFPACHYNKLWYMEVSAWLDFLHRVKTQQNPCFPTRLFSCAFRTVCHFKHTHAGCEFHWHFPITTAHQHCACRAHALFRIPKINAYAPWFGQAESCNVNDSTQAQTDVFFRHVNAPYTSLLFLVSPERDAPFQGLNRCPDCNEGPSHNLNPGINLRLRSRFGNSFESLVC